MLNDEYIIGRAVPSEADRANRQACEWHDVGVKKRGFPRRQQVSGELQGTVRAAKIERGRLIADGGKRSTSLSAARLVTNNSVDGWRPGQLAQGANLAR